MTAMGQTLLLALYGLFFACIIGLIVGIMSVLKNKFCRGFALVFVNLIRGVPMIVLAYFIFFGIPFLCNSIMKIGGVTLTALQAGTICLALNCGAYMAEIIRAGIQSVDIGQMEAARSLGLPYWRAMQRVILPQAIRTMIPSIINQFIIQPQVPCRFHSFVLPIFPPTSSHIRVIIFCNNRIRGGDYRYGRAYRAKFAQTSINKRICY